jgi:hypothetical protein
MSENIPAAEGATTQSLKTCKCGYTVDNPRVRPTYSYGMLGIFVFMFGITAVPKRVDYQCGNCSEVLDSITDPEELKRFRYRTNQR